MSDFFNSSPSFTFTSKCSSHDRSQSVSQESEEDGQFAQILQFFIRKSIHRTASILSLKIRYTERLAFRKIQNASSLELKPYQKRKIHYSYLLRSLKPIAVHLIVKQKQKAFDQLKQNYKQQRIIELAVLDKFVNNLVGRKYEALQRVMGIWAKSAPIPTLSRQKKKYAIIKLFKVFKNHNLVYFSQLTCSNKTVNNLPKSYNLKATVSMFDTIKWIIQKHYQTSFNSLKEHIKAKTLQNPELKDTPQIFSDVLRHVCFLTNKQSKKLGKKEGGRDQSHQYQRVKRMVRILDRKTKEKKRIGFMEMKVRMKEEYRVKIKQLEQIKTEIIQVNQ